MLFTQRDLKALRKSVEVISQEASRLSGLYPESAELVIAIERDINEVWNGLISRTESRKRKLTQAEQLQLFLNEFRDLRQVTILFLTTVICTSNVYTFVWSVAFAKGNEGACN